jgi:hypothetical protein
LSPQALQGHFGDQIDAKLGKTYHGMNMDDTFMQAQAQLELEDQQEQEEGGQQQLQQEE